MGAWGGLAGEQSGGRSGLAPVRFGTSGWRGILGEDFHFAGARALAKALADRLDAEGRPGPVVVAHDTRFLGPEIALELSRVLSAAGRRVLRARVPVPTPVVGHAVRTRRAAAGLMVTASHNPPAYQGIKVVAPGGGSAPLAWTRDLEQRAATILADGCPPRCEPTGRRLDPVAGYQRDLLRLLDRQAIAEARPQVVYDALHGAGSGVMDVVARALGADVTLLHGSRDPSFGGAAPDPCAARLGELSRRVKRTRGLRLGLATDGDADRFAAVDATGALLSESDAVALLVDHMARLGRARRGVAISVATGSLVEKVARAHGLPVERVPIGFKNLTDALEAGRADVAGEESGGFTWARLSRDKDGILAGALLIERVARSGRSLGHALRALQRAHGKSCCGRLAIPRSREQAGLDGMLEGLRRELPARFDGARVVAADPTRDGLRIDLSDGFVMLRASGTEPVLRVYAEAPDPERLRRRLRAGSRWLARGASG